MGRENIIGLFNQNFKIIDEVLWNVFRKNEMGDVLLPFMVLRRLDCMLEPTKELVLKTHQDFRDKLGEDRLMPLLRKSAGYSFYNTSRYNFSNLCQDEPNLALNFSSYRNSYSENVRDILENFQFDKVIDRLIKNKLLFQVISHMATIDLGPNKIDNHDMGYLFEEMIRISNEQSNETAGEHFTPRDVVELMTEIVIGNDRETLNQEGLIRTIYDPCCGTGGLLMFGKAHIQEKINAKVKVEIYGQEANEQSYAIAKSDLLITGEDSENIKHGNTLTEDQFPQKKFNYMLANPPYGVNWKKDKAFIDAESLNPAGRFSIGLPRVSDGQMLFILHMLSKMDPNGCRIGIVTSGSPLFIGDAGSGESEIRRYLIENDLVEAIIGMPGDLFYNTGIGTYVWILCNNKNEKRRGKIQLINGSTLATPEKKSLGNKRNKLDTKNRNDLNKMFHDFEESDISKIYPNEYFGYLNIPVEQPLLNKNGEPMLDKKGNVQPDSKLRDSERVALTVDPEMYFEKEVKPHLPNAWFDYNNARIGYEINFTRYFYKYQPLRSVNDILSDLKKLEEETDGLFNQLAN